MGKTKLTLSADTATVKTAKRLAKAGKTSVSSLFARLLSGMAEQDKSTASIGPLTRKASGLIRVPARRSERQLLEEELVRKYKVEE